MSNLAPQNDVLNLNPATANKTSSSNSSHKSSASSSNAESKNTEHLKNENNENSNNAYVEEDSSNENESFLNSLLKSIDENGESLAQNSLENNAKTHSKEPLKPEFSESEKLTIFESSTLTEILSLLDKLKIDGSDVKLGNLSTKLSDFVKSEANLNALKNASNFGELLDIAKDLGLNIKNIKVDRLANAIKDDFPNLNKANFFKIPVDNASKELIHSKMTQNVSKSLEKNSHHLKQNKDHSSLLSKTLQNLDSIIKDKAVKNENAKGKKEKVENLEPKSNAKIAKIEDLNDENFKNLASKDIKENLKENKKNTLSNEFLKDEIKPNEALKKDEFKKESDINEIKETKDLNSKKIEQESKAQNLSLKNEESKVLKQENILKESPREQSKETELFSSLLKDEPKKENEIKETKDLNSKKIEQESKAQNLSLKNEESKVLKQENILKESPREQSKETELFSSLLKDEFKKESDSKENKISNSKENFKEKEVKVNVDLKLNNFESLNKGSFSKQGKENSVLNELFGKDLNKDLNLDNNEELNSTQSNKNSVDELNSLVKDLSKVNQNQVKNPVSTKETLQYFSQDLKEALEQYKAPITRLNITLNPSNLGEVEVTLVQRGNNLHISFNSNTNAMNLFIQNQAEFKNSLVNMGFTGLEMNFSDQSKKEQNSGQGKNKPNSKENLENKDESKVNLELVLAKYF